MAKLAGRSPDQQPAGRSSRTTETSANTAVLGPTKSRAGKRVVAIPAVILPQVSAHMALYVGDGPDAFVITTPSGKTIWRGNFNKLVDWRKTVPASVRPSCISTICVTLATLWPRGLGRACGT